MHIGKKTVPNLKSLQSNDATLFTTGITVQRCRGVHHHNAHFIDREERKEATDPRSHPKSVAEPGAKMQVS